MSRAWTNRGKLLILRERNVTEGDIAEGDNGFSFPNFPEYKLD